MPSIKKDSYLAWFVCFGAFLTLAGITGIDTSFGVIIGTFTTKFNFSVMVTSWIPSIHSFGMFLFAFVSSILLKKYEVRLMVLIGAILCTISHLIPVFCQHYPTLFFSYGALGGAASGILYGSANIVCFYYFDKYRSIASGIAMSGTGFGVFAGPVLCNFMTIEFGYEGYFLTVTFISSMSILLSLFAFPVKSDFPYGNKEAEKNNNGEKLSLIRSESFNGSCSNGLVKPSFDRNNSTMDKINATKFETLKSYMTLLKDARFFCYCIVHFFYELAYYIPMDFLLEMMIQNNGISQKKAGSILSILGLFCMVGKWIVGLSLGCIDSCPIIISSISMVLLGACSIVYPFCSTFQNYVIVTVFYGLVLSPIEMLIPFTVDKIVGENGFKDAYGLIMLTKSISLIWGPPIAGALHDWNGVYDIAFYASGCFQLAGGFFNILVCVFHYQKAINSKEAETQKKRHNG